MRKYNIEESKQIQSELIELYKKSTTNTDDTNKTCITAYTNLVLMKYNKPLCIKFVDAEISPGKYSGQILITLHVLPEDIEDAILSNIYSIYAAYIDSKDKIVLTSTYTSLAAYDYRYYNKYVYHEIDTTEVLVPSNPIHDNRILQPVDRKEFCIIESAVIEEMKKAFKYYNQVREVD